MALHNDPFQQAFTSASSDGEDLTSTRDWACLEENLLAAGLIDHADIASFRDIQVRRLNAFEASFNTAHHHEAHHPCNTTLAACVPWYPCS